MPAAAPAPDRLAAGVAQAVSLALRDCSLAAVLVVVLAASAAPVVQRARPPVRGR